MEITAVTLLVLYITFPYTEGTYGGDQCLHLHPNNEKEVEMIRRWIQMEIPNIDVWRGVSKPGENVDVHVRSFDIPRIKKALENMGINYTVMIENLQSVLKQEQESMAPNNGYFSRFNYEKYNPYSAIKFELGSIARRFRNRCKLFTVGKTAQGQRMTGIKITNGDMNDKKPIIWIDGGIHAREWISVAFAMYFIKELLTSNSLLADRALQKYEFHILPVFNIDGYKYTFTGVRGARLWRKTRSSYGICKGADPNRNWAYKWGGTSATACNDDYRGPSPFSEIEVKNVRKYLEGIKYRLKAFWNIHAYSQMILTPWSYTKDLPKDYDEIFRVANVFVDEMKKSKDKTEYRAGPPSHLIYPVGGSAIDWVYSTLSVKYSYALELRDTGKYGFLLPADQIKPTGDETTHALLSAISAFKN